MTVPPVQLAKSLDRNAPALALSGGGFRATLFHCGALVRLNELGLLTRFVRISSVSGGSIANGMLGVAWSRLLVKDGIITNLDAEVIKPLRAFCRRPVDTSVFAMGALLPGTSVGSALADMYDDLYKGKTLQDLPDKPQFVFNATNLLTGRLVRMQKIRMADYLIGEIRNPGLRVAVAVAASSAFPPVLSPVSVGVNPAAWYKLEGAVHHGDPAYTKTLSLTDGGVYDNLGLETVDDFNPVIISDAGKPFSTQDGDNAFWPKQAMRALDIASDQARGLRMRLLFQTCKAEGRIPVYAAIDSNPADYPAAQILAISEARRRELAGMRTRLNPFSETEQGRLINWGWQMMDVAVRSHLIKEAPVPTAWPCPKQPLA